MAITVVGHHPEFTPQYVEELFKWKFGSQYQFVEGKMLTNTDFVIQHSGWSGISVKLRQTDGETAILTKTIIPNVSLRFLVSGFIGYVPYLLFGGYGNARRIETAAIEFVRTAEQFK